MLTDEATRQGIVVPVVTTGLHCGVMDAAATRRLGVPFLEALQSGRTVDAPRGFTTASTHVGPSAESIGDAVASRLDGLAIRITNIDAITRAGHAQLVTAMGRA